MIDAQTVMQWLDTVPDPEIPVISLVDLGIVRDIAWEDTTCVITITPTYSGCPAMYEMEQSIVQTLEKQGVKAKVKTSLSPAWTTDWISAKGREALKNYGIAPPKEKAIDVSGLLRRTEPAVDCPLCHSLNTRVVSQFGSTPCKALYRCMQCGEPFDYFKAH
ncbi:phenylacetate-CoA oxygenase subunit PaaJ [Paenalcaligenes hominis]|uniref:Phenylacetate-CoA oxygenase subunit PaaJ n=1 Tax=Paenalcaligenes hominis TaxID=643674 RepID=A0A1U9JZ64_9BURK|nr:1,2-phenylacetyl-CoA epoxidase subunit PaaD [Paenalcaligenes hominis]AQS51009.1 phenylacetate-CoA oxygenase subunit PaaJ [Paenalcaligenes hominis]